MDFFGFGLAPKAPWYSKGLFFRCARCGGCCRGEPGYVWLGNEEIDPIARALNISRKEFLAEFTFKSWNKISLKEMTNGDCIFWVDGQGCRIYDVRPEQCKAWPFWEMNLRTPEAWAKIAERCPGCNQGKLYVKDEIEAIMQAALKTMRG